MDSGVTNNFISEEVAIRLKLQIEVTNPVPVFMGHGHHTVSKDNCRGITLLVQDIEISEDYILLDLN